MFSRNELYWGKEAQKLLSQKHVAIFGLGGVGGYCAEMLARVGIGTLTLVDFDTVSQSNINRQIIALNSTINQSKAQLFHSRLKDINPEINLIIIDDFYTENASFNFEGIDFVADAIDTMRSKISLIEHCYNSKIPIISSLGAGNRINPEALYITDISEIKNKKDVFTSNVLYQLKKRSIESGIPVVTSTEPAHTQQRITQTEHITTKNGENIEFKKIIPASTPFVAPCAGIFMSSYITRKLLF